MQYIIAFGLVSVSLVITWGMLLRLCFLQFQNFFLQKNTKRIIMKDYQMNKRKLVFFFIIWKLDFT